MVEGHTVHVCQKIAPDALHLAGVAGLDAEFTLDSRFMRDICGIVRHALQATRHGVDGIFEHIDRRGGVHSIARRNTAFMGAGHALLEITVEDSGGDLDGLNDAVGADDVFSRGLIGGGGEMQGRRESAKVNGISGSSRSNGKR